MRKGRTDVDLISSKGVPINHIFVELNESPVLGEPESPRRSHDRLAVENEADNTLAGVDTVLDRVEKLVHLPDPRFRTVHQQLILSAPIGDFHVLAWRRFPEPNKHSVPCRDRAKLAADVCPHGPKRVIKGPGPR